MNFHINQSRLRLAVALAAMMAMSAANSSDLTAQSATKSNAAAPMAMAKEGSVGLDGYCPVCVVAGKGWVKGSPEFQSTYDGKKYYFPSADVKQMFDAKPAKYVPALGGDCTVCLKMLNKRVPGVPQHASMYNERLYLFPDADVKSKFDAAPQDFVNVDLAAGGMCTVCSVEIGKDDVKGSEEFAVFHDGMRYLFPGEEQMKMFVSNPAKYTSAGMSKSDASAVGAYLEITLKVDPANRGAAAGVYKKYKQPFLDQVAGAKSKTLLVRDDDVQVLHGFASVEQAQAYLSTQLFANDIVTELKPYLAASPDVRIYTAVE